MNCAIESMIECESESGCIRYCGTETILERDSYRALLRRKRNLEKLDCSNLDRSRSINKSADEEKSRSRSKSNQGRPAAAQFRRRQETQDYRKNELEFTSNVKKSYSRADSQQPATHKYSVENELQNTLINTLLMDKSQEKFRTAKTNKEN